MLEDLVLQSRYLLSMNPRPGVRTNFASGDQEAGLRLARCDANKTVRSASLPACKKDSFLGNKRR